MEIKLFRKLVLASEWAIKGQGSTNKKRVYLKSLDQYEDKLDRRACQLY